MVVLGQHHSVDHGGDLSFASRHSTLQRSMRMGPVVPMVTGRHNPPGFQSGGNAVPPWKVPVSVRRFTGAVCRGHETSMASTCWSARRASAVMSNAAGTK
jgi:hypothetical protein